MSQIAVIEVLKKNTLNGWQL